MRYYIRANGWGEAMHKMAERFPGETFYDVAVFENVGPMFREEVKLERKAKSKQETLRRNGARKSKHTDGILVSELQAMMGDACPVGVWA
jgi:hypothetical protein